jgi:hypothetical protein
MAGAAMVRAPGRWAGRGTVWLLSLALTGASGCMLQPASALRVWAADDLATVGADSAVVAESDVFSAAAKEIRLVAALNETLGFQLALRSAQPMTVPLKIEISDLVGPGGTISASAHTAVYRVGDVRVNQFASWYPEHTGRPATPTDFPDKLIPWDAPGAGPVRLDSTRNTLAWVDLRVPPTIGPGEYLGKLTLRDSAQNTALASYGIRLRVMPVALPSEPGLAVLCRIDPRDLLTEYLNWPREPAEDTRLIPGRADHDSAIALVNTTMRLFHEHGLTPVLWASFPKYRPLRDRRVEVDWGPYDELVSGWLSGEAFDDLVGVSRWPIPASVEFPSAAREGGLGDARCARLLASYLAECRQHFAERGWLDRAFLRLTPPEPLSAESVRQMERTVAIVRQSETDLPVVAHLPLRSLRGLGWTNSPAIDIPDVGIWAPPAMWFEPAALSEQRARGHKIWLVPDRPPYSASLAVESLPTDAESLPWLAYRYGVGALWIEHAAEFGGAEEAQAAGQRAAAECLIYSGRAYGVTDRPLGSIRMKRLRRGVQDYGLLQLLERRGKGALARMLAEQLVPWAGTDGCIDNLVNCKPAAWPHDAQTLSVAREVLLEELAADAAPQGQSADRPDRRTEWGVLMNQPGRIRAGVTGVRLTSDAEGLKARAFCSVLNATDRTVSGSWQLPAPPLGWTPPPTTLLTVGAHCRRTVEMEFALAGLAYNPDGVYPLGLQFAADSVGVLSVPTRLAVAACPMVVTGPVVDGDLSDWALATNNVAGDFRLVRGGSGSSGPQEQSARPTLATQAFFCMDRERLYVAVRCQLKPGEPPLCRAENFVTVDGGMPWGQDVVEVLIDPRRVPEGNGGDLYVLQIKPNGVVVATKGCHTEPQVGECTTWLSGSQVAVQVQSDAWLVELGLPLAALGPLAADNRLWGLNVTRLEARRGEYSSWSGARGECYTPQSLGNLLLVGR